MIRPGAEKRFDAIYNARFHPYKRFQLATKVRNLCIAAANITAAQRAELTAMISGAMVNEWHLSKADVVDMVNASRCSLCLSATEGAMAASIESLLCGVPIVTTRSIGGRDWFFMDDYVIYVEDTPEFVAEGVVQMVKRELRPELIRQVAIERLERERRMFFALVDRAFAESGQENRRFEAEFRALFHDKMNYQDRKLSEFLFEPEAGRVHGRNRLARENRRVYQSRPTTGTHPGGSPSSWRHRCPVMSQPTLTRPLRRSGRRRSRACARPFGSRTSYCPMSA